MGLFFLVFDLRPAPAEMAFNMFVMAIAFFEALPFNILFWYCVMNCHMAFPIHIDKSFEFKKTNIHGCVVCAVSPRRRKRPPKRSTKPHRQAAFPCTRVLLNGPLEKSPSACCFVLTLHVGLQQCTQMVPTCPVLFLGNSSPGLSLSQFPVDI